MEKRTHSFEHKISSRPIMKDDEPFWHDKTPTNEKAIPQHATVTKNDVVALGREGYLYQMEAI